MLNSPAHRVDDSAAIKRQKLLLRTSKEGAAPDGVAALLRQLIEQSLANLPQPGSGQTLARWRALADVAAHDLSLVKLFEGHTDALAIQHELSPANLIPPNSAWGVWAAEPPDARLSVTLGTGQSVALQGRKSWCSGAKILSHALVTAWDAQGGGPWLVAVKLDQPGVQVTDRGWRAVGMAGSGSVDVEFDNAAGQAVGTVGSYLARPGFWQGGAGIAACWYGGALALAHVLRQSLASQEEAVKTPANAIRAVALGRVDVAVQQTAALLREAAAWIDRHPHGDARPIALRVRLSAEQCAAGMLQQVGQALGAGPFCRDAHFARMAADLPVFLRQSGADRDFKALGEGVAMSGADAWIL